MEFVMLSTADWDSPFWTNKQHVALELSNSGHRVIYINSLGLRQPSINKSDIKRIARRLKQFFKKPHWVSQNLVVVSPIVIPLQRYRLVRWINKKLLGLMLWNIKRKMKFEYPLLWTYNPPTTRLLDTQCYQGIIYHCVDEIKAQPGMPFEILEPAEEELTRHADIVFVTAPKLYETRRQWNQNVWFFSNVADYKHFSLALDPLLTIPADLQCVKQPRLGFIGAISSYKLDFELIHYLAVNYPHYHIVMIGKVGEGDPHTDVELLTQLPNVHFMGPRPYDELPAYLKGFDVALLPNKINTYTENMFPMKFYEYLAAGKPVVSTQLPALKNMGQVAYLANNYQEFCRAVENALMQNSPELLQKRQDEAREHTYEVRTRRMLDIIREKLCIS